MTTKVYVDNLDAATTENDLKNLFSAYGNVADVNIVVDRTNQKPRGFGFVTMATPEGARAAIRALHGKQLATQTLIVSEAWSCEEHVGSSRERRNPHRSPASLAKPQLKGTS
jgi:cold-inducible RNA-binding protein